MGFFRLSLSAINKAKAKAEEQAGVKETLTRQTYAEARDAMRMRSREDRAGVRQYPRSAPPLGEEENNAV